LQKYIDQLEELQDAIDHGGALVERAMAGEGENTATEASDLAVCLTAGFANMLDIDEIVKALKTRPTTEKEER